MFNLFKMERYRARKSKVVIITLLITAFISFFSVSAGTIGIDEGINICSEFTGILSNPMLLIIWAITISIYIAGEYKNGFIKSIAGQVEDRGYLAISKLLFSIMYTMEMFAVIFIVVAISAFVFSGNNIIFGFSTEMIVLWCVQFLLHIGFSCIFILITTLTRSSSLGIGLGIFMGCGLTGLAYTGISWGVNKLGVITNFNLGSYMIENNIQYMQSGISSEYIVRAILVGIVFLVVMTYASMRVLNKRDI